MLIIAEIILTIFAWRNGWRWFSLLPMGIGFAIGMISGFVISISGGSFENTGWVMIFELAIIASLITMVCKKPKTSKTETKQLLND